MTTDWKIRTAAILCLLVGTAAATRPSRAEWRRVMGSSPGYFTDCGPDCPVEDVSGDEVLEFLDRLSMLEGQSFRLPTEAEWEYAGRAGTTGPFSTGDGITTDQANFDGRYPYPWSEKGWGEYLGRPAACAAPCATPTTPAIAVPASACGWCGIGRREMTRTGRPPEQDTRGSRSAPSVAT